MADGERHPGQQRMKSARRRCDACGEPEGKGPWRISALSTVRLCQPCKQVQAVRFADWVARQLGYAGVDGDQCVVRAVDRDDLKEQEEKG